VNLQPKNHVCFSSLQCVHLDMLTLTLKEAVWRTEDRQTFNNHLTEFVADTLCPSSTNNVNVTLVDVASNRLIMIVVYFACKALYYYI